MNVAEVELPRGVKVVVPLGLPKSEIGYQMFLQNGPKNAVSHLNAMVCLLSYPMIGVRRSLHMFGGVGAMAQVLDQLHPGSEHEFWEKDQILVKYLNDIREGSKVVLVQDSIEFALYQDLTQFDLVMIDATQLTIKSSGVKEVWSRLNESKVKYVWLTDSACSKLHLNYKSYSADFGVEVENSVDSYFGAYNAWLGKTTDYSLVSAVRETHATYCLAVLGSDEKFSTPIRRA